MLDVDFLKEQNEKLIDQNKELIKLIDQIVTLTYARPDSAFETIVFQRYGKKPTIVYKGEEVDLENADHIQIEFDIGESGDEFSSWIRIED